MEKAFPTSRIGVRISPNGVFNGMGSADNHDAFVHYAKRLQKMNLAYLRCVLYTGPHTTALAW